MHILSVNGNAASGQIHISWQQNKNDSPSACNSRLSQAILHSQMKQQVKQNEDMKQRLPQLLPQLLQTSR